MIKTFTHVNLIIFGPALRRRNSRYLLVPSGFTPPPYVVPTLAKGPEKRYLLEKTLRGSAIPCPDPALAGLPGSVFADISADRCY